MDFLFFFSFCLGFKHRCYTHNIIHGTSHTFCKDVQSKLGVMISHGPSQPRIWKENKSLPGCLEWVKRNRKNKSIPKGREKWEGGDYFIKMHWNAASRWWMTSSKRKSLEETNLSAIAVVLLLWKCAWTQLLQTKPYYLNVACF